MNKKIIKCTVLGVVAVFILFYISGIFFPPSVSEGRINEALAFCKKNDLNTEYAIFVDFGKHSGRERYMIYRFSQQVTLGTGTLSRFQVVLRMLVPISEKNQYEMNV